MNSIDLKILPSKVVFTLWLKHLLINKRAWFSKRHEGLVLLNTGVSAAFGLGRDTKTNHPIIGCPSSFIPWFLIGNISRIIITHNDSVYFEFGGDKNPFYIGLSISKKRIKCLLPNEEDSMDLIKTIDMHGYRIISGTEVDITKPLNRAPVHLVRSIDEIIVPKKGEQENWNDNLNQKYDIHDPSNFENLKDPLIF